MKRCYIFDIDGTVADLTHRLHHISDVFDAQGMKPKKNWDAFFAACTGDAPIPHIIELAQTLATRANSVVVFVSGRSDRVREQTLDWLDLHGFHRPPLYMRADGDHRPDFLVKGELLDRVLADGYQPIMAFDDRDQVVKMWRERGVPCAQVAEGAF